MSRYIDEHRGRFGVEPIGRVLDVSTSAYYQRAAASARRAWCKTNGSCITASPVRGDMSPAEFEMLYAIQTENLLAG